MRLLPLLGAIALLGIFLSCDDPPVTDDSPADLGAPTPGAEVNVGYLHHTHADLLHSPGEPLTISVDDGELIIERLLFVISALELHRCAPTNELAPRPLDLLIPSAHAHVPSSATRFGTPWVEDLLGPPGSARMAGGIAPPPGDYCELHIVLVPADDDAINLTTTPPDEIEDHTVLISGQWRDQDQPFQPFLWTSDLRRVIPISLPDPHTGEHPLHLRDSQQILLLIDKLLHPGLFTAVTLEHTGPDFTPFVDALIDELSLYHYDQP